MKEKSKQIPESLYIALIKFFLLDVCDRAIEEEIKKGLHDKLEADIRRDLYTRYKTAPTEKQQETARQEYLDRVGMLKGFRW